ncbi:NAD(P)H-dependent flavin oxidoreductase [Dactylococcopsis salina]|uniref:2-nitropropane dioxygenase-like enzyme n=1 Tax=Dactylococcopsis salina (strain PCC 8305) TaxID=13035 RepID=K9YV22_DACS8|nr:nitronate monooxygenase family protein [Dactylococcopsis salina]AFZ50766.1 2-nitropropane dioxygenase-like enzyme [Dactylococcopsis salina PCC 8305]
MMTTTLPKLHIGNYVAPYPIIQGGMGIRISGASLASAVANTGGIGIISAVALGFASPYFDPKQRGKRDIFEANRLALIDELKKARDLSPNGIIGINSMVAGQDHETLTRTATENGANLIIAGAGLPLNLPKYTRDYPDVALIPVISSTRAAKVICRKWEKQYGRLPDGFVVENPNSAGGHLGAKKEELGQANLDSDKVIPELVAYLREELEVEIPVIAAGGIWDRSDIDRALSLGASGVQMGTRFITTNECDAHIKYKEFHRDAKPEDVVIVPSPVGLPGRALKNSFAEKAINHVSDLDKRCFGSCLQVCSCRDRAENYCIARALDRAARGDIENGLIFAGSNAGRANQITSVAELMKELVSN